MLLFLAILLFSPLADDAGFNNSYTYRIAQESWVSINGTTNINQFSCTSDGHIPRGEFLVNFHPDEPGISFSEASLDLRVDSFDCGKSRMNKDFQNTLNQEQHPFIQITLLQIHPATETDKGKEVIIAEVEIKIGGSGNKTEIPVVVEHSEDHRFQIKGSKTLLMSDFNLDPPSPFMGLIKVSDKMDIHFNLLIEARMLSGNQ